MTFLFPQIFKTKQRDLVGRAAASESGAEPAWAERIGGGDLLRNIERLVKIEADDGGSKLDLPRPAGQM